MLHWLFVRFTRPATCQSTPVQVDELESRRMLSSVVAAYRADFRRDLPLTPGWQYLWNAPDGWNPTADATGNMATGSIEDPSSFRALQDAGVFWTADGDTSPLNHAPANSIKLTSTGGYAGPHAGLATGGGTNQLARYAIAAYTVSADGYYAIANSWLTKPGGGGDPIEVRISVNGGSPYAQVFCNNRSTIQFDTWLGQLESGDTIYVALGPNESSASDAFEMDFAVVETAARPEPLRSLIVARSFHVADYGATPNDSTDDAPAIQAALDAANAWQQANHRPVQVDFSPGVYRLYPGYGSGPRPARLSLENARDIVIAGNGAQLLVTNPTVGVFQLDTCSNMIVRDFTIDYETLPFTQGIIKSIVDSAHFVYEIAGGYPKPTDAQFLNTAERWGYPVDPLTAGRVREGAYNLYGTADASYINGRSYLITAKRDTSTLRVGDRYVMLARYSGNPQFALPGSTQVSIIGVTSYAGPSGFVAGQYSAGINLINSHAAIKPGRWKGLNADGMHIQSARVGVWAENSSFEGLSDDGANFYTIPFAVTEVLSPTQLRLGILQSRGTAVGEFDLRQLRTGDRLSFMNPQTGAPLADVRVTAVDVAAQTVTLDQPVAGVVIGTTKDATHVYNTSLLGAFHVQGTSFLNGRRYGMMIKASNGQVLGNHFEGLSREAISIYNEPEWPEGHWGGDILIQGNTFIDNGFEYIYKNSPNRTPGTISIYAQKLGDLNVHAAVYAHPRIQILSNSFQGWRGTAVHVANAQDVDIAGNWFAKPVDDPLFPNQSIIALNWSQDVRVSGNTFPVLDPGDEYLSASNVSGLVATASVGDLVWHDRNGNGFQDTGEAGLSGILATLYTADGQVVGYRKTDASGRYRFHNLPAGSYHVKFRAPGGYYFSPARQRSLPSRDSDADALGRTSLFSLEAGQADLTIDAGISRRRPQ